MSIYTKRQKIRGFTLIEVLLAIAIFAMISLASFSVFDGVIQSERFSNEKMQRLNDIQRAWLVIERDFLQIAARSMRVEGETPLENFIHTEHSSFSTSDESIAFVRHGWTNPGLLIPRSDLQSVAYRINDNVLERLHFNFVDAVTGEEPRARKLIEQVTAFDIEYFYKSKWQNTLIKAQFPKAIKLIVETEDIGIIERKFLIADGLNEVRIMDQRRPDANGDSQNNSTNAQRGNTPSRSSQGDQR
ncbi:type II secretion system minor pseudopilin GspJ [Colwellia sp. 1_MG-2023]|uniref:type II secretion system minor pseudopilin GspJ n=1 Tax=Colwellia sp. 1_MG-2023 TaxID=3062649 RepID=UPI0026E1D860|nr:type II secretion system minor pseudopilin GspJ [Colwellia sp. 1_MG-2023]MDO6447436.1 type II secretion system minor pseudopilin GspJ [Colwellia sp. 1_MG-2023]